MPTDIRSRDTARNYAAAFERLEFTRAHEPAWLRATRRAAMSAFGRQGFPTTRDEEWRFTSVAPIAENLFAPAPEAVAVSREAFRALLVPGVQGPVLAFVNGRFAPSLSSSGGDRPQVTLTSLSEALAAGGDRLEPHLARHAGFARQPFTALNTALFEDGALVEVAAGTVVEQPIQIVFLSVPGAAPTSSWPRALILIGSNSHARIIETFAGVGPGRGLTTAVTEVVAADGAVVDHYRLQRESDAAFHIGQTVFHLGRSSSSSSHVASFGGRISRHDALAVLADEGVDCTLNGLYVADGDQVVDHHTEIDHAKPHGTSHEMYKGILGGRAHGVFNGRIRVRADAQKTDARQTNKTLLLTDEAQVNTKPQLEIFANDVKCTHGATVGQLSDEALFYLRARGIGREDARAMLIRAFASDVTSRMALEPVRVEVERLMAERLPGASAEKVVA
jgi:Fe-S cluster assembly protein SufD